MKEAEIEAQATQLRKEDGFIDFSHEFYKLLKQIEQNTRKV